MSDETVHKTDREIEEDVMNVPFIAWLGSISTVLIIVAVLLLTGVFYLTQRQQTAERQRDADARITELEAQRAIDAMVVDGYYKQPDGADEKGEPIPGTVSIPVTEGMRKVVEDANR
ncbi:MAG: hypothetical protein AAGI22_26390 [Planctomycetota bacterium]